MKKYKILECLDKLTCIEYKIAIKELPKITGTTLTTIRSYAKLDIKSEIEIPYLVVAALEQYFKLNACELCNVPVSTKQYSQVIVDRHYQDTSLKKYKIRECLDKLTRIEYKIAIKELAKITGTCVNTIWNYANLDIKAKTDIPYLAVVALERYFKLKAGGLCNVPVHTKQNSQVIIDRHPGAAGQKKYKILECLDKLSPVEYKIATKELAKITGTCVNTIWNYANLDIKAKTDIPYLAVVALERYFKLNAGELCNVPVHTRQYSQVIVDRYPVAAGQKKYKILECLNKLSHIEYRMAFQELPKIIGREINSFWNYAKLDINAKGDIPYSIVAALEQYFKLNAGELCNVPIANKKYSHNEKPAEVKDGRHRDKTGPKKYKILECLDKLPRPEYRVAIKELAKIIGKTQNTVWTYAYIDKNAKKKIPDSVVAALEQYFKLNAGELCNVPVQHTKRYSPTKINYYQDHADLLISHEDLLAIIENDIAALPEKMRTIYELKKKKGMTRTEISKHLGVPENTVKTNIYRASKILPGDLHLLRSFEGNANVKFKIKGRNITVIDEITGLQIMPDR